MSKPQRSQTQSSAKTQDNVQSRQNQPSGDQTSPAQALFQTLPAMANNVNVLALETLQQSVGNDAVNVAVQNVQRSTDGVIQRDWLDGLTGSDSDNDNEEEADPEQQALEEFLARGVIPNEEGEAIVGPQNTGGFNVKFDTTSRTLIVMVNVGINFHHALTIEPTSGFVFPDFSGFDLSEDASDVTSMWNASTQIMTSIPTIADRITEVNTKWRWSPAEENPWMENYRNAVQNAWGGQHRFRSNRWNDVVANVAVLLDVHKGSQEGDHCSARIIKTPPGQIGAYVSPGTATGTTDENAHNQGLYMSSSGVGPSATNFLRYQLRFPEGSDDLWQAQGMVHSNDAGPAYLDKFIADFRAADPTAGAPIQVIGRANTVGDDNANQILSENRAREVEDYLRTNGLNGSIDRVSSVGEGETGATEAAAWRRVDIIVGSGEAQITAVHEFGHMIGLDDEYSSPAGGFAPGAGTPIPIGNPAAHNALASQMGGGVTGAVGENTDNIMSVGNTVRPQHYATFHHALEQVTGEQWTYAAP